jgi:hypothetical protein
LTDYTDYANEIAKSETSFTKGIWVIKFLWKANTIKGAKHRIEALITSTCNLLKVICKSRLNRQVLVFMQLFKGFVDSNITPDVGSYIEAFSKDFEALFKIHNFTIQKPLIPSEMKRTILHLKEEKQLEKDKDVKIKNESSESEEEEGKLIFIL